MDQRLLKQRWPVRELAAPPPGSELPRCWVMSARRSSAIPAGTLVSVSGRFDPARFVAGGGREDKSHRYAWMPFGGGAHKRIGMFEHEMLRAHRWFVRDSPPNAVVVYVTAGTGGRVARAPRCAGAR